MARPLSDTIQTEPDNSVINTSFSQISGQIVQIKKRLVGQN